MKIDKRESFAAVAQIEKIKESTSNNLILNIILVPRTKNVKSHKKIKIKKKFDVLVSSCLLYTSPSPRDKRQSRMPSSA